MAEMKANGEIESYQWQKIIINGEIMKA